LLDQPAEKAVERLDSRIAGDAVKPRIFEDLGSTEIGQPVGHRTPERRAPAGAGEEHERRHGVGDKGFGFLLGARCARWPRRAMKIAILAFATGKPLNVVGPDAMKHARFTAEQEAFAAVAP